MKRKLLLILLLLTLCMLTACGVSQSDYDALKSENESLISQNNSLQSDLEEMTQLNTVLSKEKVDSFGYILSNGYVNLWLEVAFDGKASYSIVDNKLHVNIFYDEDNYPQIIDIAMDDLTSAMSQFGTYYGKNPEDLTFDMITMNFYDKGNNGILGSSFLVNQEEINSYDIMINLTHIDELAESRSGN